MSPQRVLSTGGLGAFSDDADRSAMFRGRIEGTEAGYTFMYDQ